MNTNTWNAPLPWHYLGAIHSLIYGQAVKGQTLMEVLMGLSDPDFKEALRKDQGGSDTGGLIARVAALAAQGAKQEYNWSAPWPTGLAVQLRRGILDMILSPTALVIPWPFPGDMPTSNGAQRQVEARRVQLVTPTYQDIPTYSSPVTIATLYLFRYMKAADDALRTGSGFPTSGTCAQQTAWVEMQAGTTTPHQGVEVCGDSQLETYLTRWELHSGSLRLCLGLKQATTSCPPPDGIAGLHPALARAIRELLQLYRPRFDEWPSGYGCD